MTQELKVFRQRMGKMEDWTTHDYLNELAERYKTNGHPLTDYGLHKLLGVVRQTIYRYRDGKGTFDDSVALRVAGLLDINPEFMLMWATRERARVTQAKETYDRILRRMKNTMLPVVFICVASTLLSLDPSASAGSTAYKLYIMSNHALAIWCALYLFVIAALLDHQHE